MSVVSSDVVSAFALTPLLDIALSNGDLTWGHPGRLDCSTVC